MRDRTQKVHNLLEQVRQNKEVDVFLLCRYFRAEIDQQVSSVPRWWREEAQSQVCTGMLEEVLKKIF
ncbi:hypothetical protein [Alicyclobacillus tolerans]|uniref:Uncharacterized protein n=2 Tax=Alicyclobacillus tolerans TaxID=90970 RepID=A0ABT9M096_9BACL|nr:hypothetical protein [Alicyclobacillus tengchongensis]MDP9729916.1 hypothetical protein [Alicyclobacillus tengchongensis]